MKELTALNFLACPVCGIKLRTADVAVNNHLDLCLTRGVKRKLTQRTLFQVNFSSQAISQISCNKLNCVNPNDGSMSKNDGHQTCYRSSMSTQTPECDVASKVNVSTSSGASLGSSVSDNAAGSDEGLLSEGNSNVDFAFTINEDENPVLSIASRNHPVRIPATNGMQSLSQNEDLVTAKDIEGAALETYIVGRKFSDERSIDLGTTVSLSRDPDNPKDSFAVKVQSADSSRAKVFGFLPRELAQYISPIIDKFNLDFEGCVISQSTVPSDPVSIRLFCRNVTLHNMDQKNIETLTCLWKDILHAVDAAKKQPPMGLKCQQNFQMMVQEVLSSNNHLFTSDEKEYIESFNSLPLDSQRLFVRLYTRKGPWFRLLKISYPEISDIQQAVNSLQEERFLQVVEHAHQLQEVSLKEIFNLVSLPELRDIACVLKKNSGAITKKSALIAYLCSSFHDHLSLLNLILERAGTCIQISPTIKVLIRRVERLFFLNQEQDLTTFLLSDLGIIKYPAYNCIARDPIFTSRASLLAFEEATELNDQMEEFLENDNREAVFLVVKTAESRIVSDVSPPAVKNFHSRFSPSWVYARALFKGIGFLERVHRYKDAIDLLKLLLSRFPFHERRGCWMLRLSINLEHIHCVNESLEVAETALNDPSVRAGTKTALQRRVLRLGKPPRRWKFPAFAASLKRIIPQVHIRGRPLNSVTGVKSRFYGEDGEQCSVEQLALQYYAGEGGAWYGIHTESGIWLTIFGLLMWEIIFSDVPDVFHNKFQTAPLDFATDSFYAAREAMIEDHLEKIRGGLAEEILITSWQKHAGTACRGVNWERHSLSDLRAAVKCAGGGCVAALLRHLARDYRSWSSGMPDLVLWRFGSEYEGEAKLVEVKGPRDSLSEQQRAWLLQLIDCGFSVEICKVSAHA